MAQVQPAVNAFIDEVEALERNFNKNLRTATRNLSKLSDTELINAMGQLNLFNEIVEQGYGQALDRFENEYALLLQEAVRVAEARGVTALSGAGLQGLEVLKDLNIEKLLGDAKEHTDALTVQLFQNLYAGISPNQIVDSLLGEEGMSLASHQLQVAAYTGIKTFDDMARYKIFEGLDVKWTYFGPLDDRTRDACRETKENEPEGGYTEKQIKSKEVQTKFGTRGGFNCRHSWEVR